MQIEHLLDGVADLGRGVASCRDQRPNQPQMQPELALVAA
jgi:hypothetical protein